MNKHLYKQLFIVYLSSSLLACAAPAESPDEPSYAQESRGHDCISQMSIRDYTVLDDANLIVSGSGKRAWHVVLTRRAFGLRSTWQIGFQSRTGQVCPGFSDLVLDDGMGVERIPVRSVRGLTPDEQDELLIRFGKKEPEVKQTPEPQEVEGAEVEGLD